MTKLNKNVQDLIKKAREKENHTKEESFKDFQVAPAGKAAARFIEYIEVGNQPQRAFKGKAKPDADTAIITFELLSPKHISEFEHEGQQITRANKITFRVKKSFSSKANFKKLFEKMRYGRDGIDHIAQMLGEAFIVNIIHNTVKQADGSERTYANISSAEMGYMIESPHTMDAETGESKAIKVRDPISEIKLFLFETPTKESWDSLFIDGEKTKTNNKGEEEVVSNNWIQDLIVNATNFEGSAVEVMLEGGDAIPQEFEESSEETEEVEENFETEEEEFTEEPEEEVAPKKIAKSAPAVKAQPAKVGTQTSKTASPSKAAPVKKSAPVAATKTVAKSAPAKTVAKAPAAKSAKTASTVSPSSKSATAKAKNITKEADDALAALGLDV